MQQAKTSKAPAQTSELLDQAMQVTNEVDIYDSNNEVRAHTTRKHLLAPLLTPSLFHSFAPSLLRSFTPSLLHSLVCLLVFVALQDNLVCKGYVSLYGGGSDSLNRARTLFDLVLSDRDSINIPALLGELGGDEVRRDKAFLWLMQHTTAHHNEVK